MSLHKQIWDLIEHYMALTSTNKIQGNIGIWADEAYKRAMKYEFDFNNVKQAFEDGMRDDIAKMKQGGTFFYFKVSGQVFVSWIEARHKLIYIPKGSAEQKPIPSAQEQDQMCEDALEICIRNYKRTGQINDYGGVIFKYLWRKKRLRFDNEKTQEYIQQARGVETARLEGERKTALDKGIRIDVQKQLRELTEDKLKVVARELALKEWIDQNY